MTSDETASGYTSSQESAPASRVADPDAGLPRVLDERRSIEFVYDKTQLGTVDFDNRHGTDVARESFRLRFRNPGDPVGFRFDILKENFLSSRFEGFGFEVAVNSVQSFGRPDDKVIPIYEFDAGLSARLLWGHFVPVAGEDQIVFLELPARAGAGIDVHGVRLTVGVQPNLLLGYVDGPFVGPMYSIQAGVYGHLEWRAKGGPLLSLHASGGQVESMVLSAGFLF